jgi:hypothetical protein
MREHNRLLDEYCHEIGRDPGSIERAHLHMYGEEGDPVPFVSCDAFQDYVGRYRDAGTQRFMFGLGNAASPFVEGMAAGLWASRETLDAFAAQAMRDLSSQSSSR